MLISFVLKIHASGPRYEARCQIIFLNTDLLVFQPELINSIPGQLGEEDIEDFCSLAQYYASRTPQSFRKVTGIPLHCHIVSVRVLYLFFLTSLRNKFFKVAVQFELCFWLMEHKIISVILLCNPIKLYITEKLIKFFKLQFYFYLVLNFK